MAQQPAALNTPVITPPDYFNLLPSEILTFIFKLTENPSSSYTRRRDEKRKQAFVCRRWYHLRVEREIFHTTSLKQLKALIRVLKLKKGQKGKLVKEVKIALTNDKPKGKLESIISIIGLCPHLKKFHAEVRGRLYFYDDDFESNSPVWELLRKLDLIEFKCNVLKGIELTRTLLHWPNFKKLNLEPQGFYYYVKSIATESIYGEEYFTLPFTIQSFPAKLQNLGIEIGTNEDLKFLKIFLVNANLEASRIELHHVVATKTLKTIAKQSPNLKELYIGRSTE